MTSNQLKAQIAQMKVDAFDHVWTARDIEPQHTGHKSKEHRALDTIARAAKQIEAAIQKWERDNPE